jgi:hypothetical protein
VQRLHGVTNGSRTRQFGRGRPGGLGPCVVAL